MIMSLLPCNCVMFVYIAYNLVMLLFFSFISLSFMVNKRVSMDYTCSFSEKTCRFFFTDVCQCLQLNHWQTQKWLGPLASYWGFLPAPPYKIDTSDTAILISQRRTHNCCDFPGLSIDTRLTRRPQIFSRFHAEMVRNHAVKVAKPRSLLITNETAVCCAH